MATNFPTSIDSFTNPTSGDTLDSPSHAAQHTNINDAMVAVQTRLGTGTGTIGDWTTFTPTWTFGANAITSSASYGRFMVLNDLVIVKAFFRFASTAGSGNLTLTVPSDCSISPPVGYDRLGYSVFYDQSLGTSRNFAAGHSVNSTTVFNFYSENGGAVTDTSPVTFAGNDEIFVTLIGIKA